MAKQTTSISHKSLLMTLCLAFFALPAACDKPQTDKAAESAPPQTATTEETVNGSSSDTTTSTTKTAPIVDIAVNSDETLLATAQGKEIAIWDIKTGKRISTTQMPIEDDNGSEFFGIVYAVIFLPQKNILGFSGVSSYIYFYDIDKHKIITKLATDTLIDITSLCTSPDGRYIAATYKGVQVWQVSNWEKIMDDKTYGNTLSSLSFSCEFSRDNKLITSALDGTLRLYKIKNEHVELTKINKLNNSTIFKLALHQDSERIAVSYMKDGEFFLGIGNVNDLIIEDKVDESNINNVIFARGLTWSQNGTYLYAGGKYHNMDGKAPVFYWTDNGLGKRYQILGGNTYVQSIVAIKNGSIIVATADPSWLIQDQQGNLLLKNQD
jgi:hypothetical protein